MLYSAVGKGSRFGDLEYQVLIGHLIIPDYFKGTIIKTTLQLSYFLQILNNYSSGLIRKLEHLLSISHLK